MDRKGSRSSTRYPGQKARKRHFRGNQYTAETDTKFVSTSAEKLIITSSIMASDEHTARMKERFNEELRMKRGSSSQRNRAFINAERYEKLIEEIILAKMADRKKPRDYWLLKHYDIISVDDKDKLIYPGDLVNGNIIYYAADSELFDALHEAHIKIGHGGRDRMIKELSLKYKNVTRYDIELYLQLCELCQSKTKVIKLKNSAGNHASNHTVKPVVSLEPQTRCQVEFIDFQSRPDGDYKFIMVYQDNPSKFVVLKPLKAKSAEEVAQHLLEIFTLIGAPAILHSDNDRELASQIVQSLKKCWPTLNIVHGKSSHSRNLRSDEQNSKVIQSILFTWLQENNTEHWSEGMRFVQLKKNGTYHSEIKKTPYEALFGSALKVGIQSLPHTAAEHLESEEDLINLLQCAPTEPLCILTTSESVASPKRKSEDQDPLEEGPGTTKVWIKEEELISDDPD